MGSMAFAGLALFGSTILIRAFAITKYDSWKQRGGAMAVVAGTLFVAILHVGLAFGYFQLQLPIIFWATAVPMAGVVAGAGLVAPNSKEQPKGGHPILR